MQPSMTIPFEPKSAAFYAKFIKFAVEMYKKDPKNLEPEPPYELTQKAEIIAYIKAVDRPHLSAIKELNREEEYTTFGSVFYGYVARLKSSSSKQLTNKVIIVIRGTQSWDEWVLDGWILPTLFKPIPESGRVARGFFNIFSSMLFVLATNREEKSLMKFVRDHLLNIEDLHLIVAGHSLGAALSTMLMLNIVHDFKQLNDSTEHYALACPDMGTRKFVTYFDNTVKNSYRIWHKFDWVADALDRIPYLHNIDGTGSEIILTAEQIMKLRREKDFHRSICPHILPTYLWLLDPSNYDLSSDCICSQNELSEETASEIVSLFYSGTDIT
jgi:hypothetical protein